MTFTFPLVSPIPINTVGANAGSAIVCLVPGATPQVEPTAKHISITMAMSSPSVFAMATFSPLTVITYKDGVCTVSGPPAYVIPTMLEGIKFTYDMHRDISKEKINVVIHDGTATSMQTLTFAKHDSVVRASIAAAKDTTFTIDKPSLFPKIVLQDQDGSGKAQAAVTIIPETPSAIESIGTDSTFWASVHINAMTNAGKYVSETLSSAKNVTGKNILSFCYKGNVSQLNHALATTHFVAPQAIGSNTVLHFVIVISDDTSTIMSQRITLNGVHAADHTKEIEATEYAVFGTMEKSALPPAPVNGVPYTLQIVNGTPTWMATKQAAATVLPVNVAPPNKPTVAILAPFTSTVSSDTSSVENLRTVAAMTAPAAAPSATASNSKTSVFDYVLTILILIICLGLFGFLGWIIYKDWSSA